jgi:hypothetical protein
VVEGISEGRISAHAASAAACAGSGGDAAAQLGNAALNTTQEDAHRFLLQGRGGPLVRDKSA